MNTYIYTATNSPARGFNVRITVWRIKQNQPHWIGTEDHHTKAWRGERPTACRIIHKQDKLPLEDNGYSLKNMLAPADLYDTTSGPGIRLFGI
jgi:hypothetical protein